MRPARLRGIRLVANATLFLAPAIAAYTVFVVYPLIGSVGRSLFEADPTGDRFVGLANYQRLLGGDPSWTPPFFRALGNTVQWFLTHMFIQLSVALLLALLLTSRNLRGRAILRVLVFAPTVLSVVIVGFIWQLILSPLWGIAPVMLETVGLGSLYGPWLGQEGPALIVISLMSTWQWMGIPMILFSAALIGIPDELLEAARVDGAGRARVFWSVQLPLILPTIGVAALLTFIGSMKSFDLIYAVQGPQTGPNNSTDVIATYFYKTFYGVFGQAGNPSMGATVGSATLLIVVCVVAVYFMFVQRRLQRFEA